MTEQINPDTGEVMASLDMPKTLAEAITQVMAKVGKLAKEEKNQHGGYNFASVDAFLEAVQPACAEAGLFIMQDEEDFEIRDGWLVLRYRFTLGHKSGAVWAHQPRRTIMVNAKQGSQAFGAAQSYALKQFMRSLFQIATGDKEDADYHPQSENLPAGRQQPAAPAKRYTGKAQRGHTQQTTPSQDFVERVLNEFIPECQTLDQLKDWWKKNYSHIQALSDDQRKRVENAKERRKAKLSQAPIEDQQTTEAA